MNGDRVAVLGRGIAGGQAGRRHGGARAAGVVVRIEQDLTHCPLGSFQRSHSPANANNSPALTSKQYGCFALPQFPARFLRVLPDDGNWLSRGDAVAGTPVCFL
jgi:hypothetical protein